MPSSAKSITVQLIKRASLERWFTAPTFCIWRHITCTRYVINQVCGIDGHIGLSVWHWMNSNNQKSRKKYLQISNSYKNFDIYICKFTQYRWFNSIMYVRNLSHIIKSYPNTSQYVIMYRIKVLKSNLICTLVIFLYAYTICILVYKIIITSLILINFMEDLCYDFLELQYFW